MTVQAIRILAASTLLVGMLMAAEPTPPLCYRQPSANLHPNSLFQTAREER